MKWFIINIGVTIILAVTGVILNKLIPGHVFIEQLSFFAMGYATHYFQCKATEAPNAE